MRHPLHVLADGIEMECLVHSGGKDRGLPLRQESQEKKDEYLVPSAQMLPSGSDESYASLPFLNQLVELLPEVSVAKS